MKELREKGMKETILHEEITKILGDWFGNKTCSDIAEKIIALFPKMMSEEEIKETLKGIYDLRTLSGIERGTIAYALSGKIIQGKEILGHETRYLGTDREEYWVRIAKPTEYCECKEPDRCKNFKGSGEECNFCHRCHKIIDPAFGKEKPLPQKDYKGNPCERTADDFGGCIDDGTGYCKNCHEKMPQKECEYELAPCPFCGEKEQLQVQVVDAKNPERDLVKCRKCRGEAPRGYWNKTKPHQEPQGEIEKLNLPVFTSNYFKGKKPAELECLYNDIRHLEDKLNELIASHNQLIRKEK